MTLDAARAILDVRKENPAPSPSPFYSTEELAAFEGTIDQDGGAVVGRDGQQLTFCIARHDRIVELDKIDWFVLENPDELIVGAGRVVRHADVTHPPLLFPFTQGAEMRVPVYEVVNLHQVKALEAQAL